MSQSEDLAAINSYFSRTGAKNAQATAAKNNFFQWYQGLSTWSKAMDDDVLVEAKQRRINFNALNGDVEDVPATITKAEKEEWLNKPIVNVTGMTPEQTAKAIWTPKGTAPAAATTITSAIKRPLIKMGSTGPDVADWQKIIGVTPDGKFGSGTHNATVAWQKAHGLTPDGKVGPNTWTKAASLTQPQDKGIIQTIAEAVAGVAPQTQSPVTAPTGAAQAVKTPARATVRTAAAINAARATTTAAPAPVAAVAVTPAIQLPSWTKWLGLGVVAAVLGASVVGFTKGRRS